MKQAEKSGRQ